MSLRSNGVNTGAFVLIPTKKKKRLISNQFLFYSSLANIKRANTTRNAKQNTLPRKIFDEYILVLHGCHVYITPSSQCHRLFVLVDTPPPAPTVNTRQHVTSTSIRDSFTRALLWF